MQGHAVHGRGHAELAHAVMEVAAGIVGGVERDHALDEGVVGAGQVGRAADHFRNDRDQLFQGRAGVDAGGVVRLGLGGGGRIGGQLVEGAGRQLARHGALEVGGLGAGLQAGFPGLADASAATTDGLPGAGDVGGHGERAVGPAHRLAGVADLVVEQGVAVAVGVAFLGARALGDQGLAGDQGRAVLLGRPTQGGGDLNVVVAVDGLDGPAGGLETQQLVAGLGDRGFTVDGGVVVVEQHGQLVELQAAGDADRLVADALHQAAVAGDHPGAVVDDILAEARGQVGLGHGHADRHRQALAQRAGGAFDAGGVVHLGVAGGQRAPLTEVLDLRHRHGLEAGQVQQGIEQHRAVAGRQHEAVAVGPVGLGRVELQELAPQHRRHIGHAHRHALVSGLGLVDRIHRKDADRVGHLDGRNGHGKSVLFCVLQGCARRQVAR